jgi:hypothetical protein
VLSCRILRDPVAVIFDMGSRINCPSVWFKRSWLLFNCSACWLM